MHEPWVEARYAEVRGRFLTWLLDDTLRGGDLDVYCVLPERPADLSRKKARFRAAAEDGLVVDVVVRTPETAPGTIHRHAERTGIRL